MVGKRVVLGVSNPLPSDTAVRVELQERARVEDKALPLLPSGPMRASWSGHPLREDGVTRTPGGKAEPGIVKDVKFYFEPWVEVAREGGVTRCE